jgi:hypothetical protein
MSLSTVITCMRGIRPYWIEGRNWSTLQNVRRPPIPARRNLHVACSGSRWRAQTSPAPRASALPLRLLLKYAPPRRRTRLGQVLRSPFRSGV